jgi:hypothetical protein
MTRLLKQTVYPTDGEICIDRIVDEIRMQQSIEELAFDTTFALPQYRAAVTVIRPGVMGKSWIGDPVHGFFPGSTHGLRCGSTIDAGIDVFQSDPGHGGRLALRRWFGQTVLSGLVDPVTATPRVEIDLFDDPGQHIGLLVIDNGL